MTQELVREHASHHRLTHRNGAAADAGIVTPLGDQVRLVAVAVNCLARLQDRRGRLHGKARDNILARGNAAQNAARMVGEEQRLAVIAKANLVGVFLTLSLIHI